MQGQCCSNVFPKQGPGFLAQCLKPSILKDFAVILEECKLTSSLVFLFVRHSLLHSSDLQTTDDHNRAQKSHTSGLDELPWSDVKVDFRSFCAGRSPVTALQKHSVCCGQWRSHPQWPRIARARLSQRYPHILRCGEIRTIIRCDVALSSMCKLEVQCPLYKRGISAILARHHMKVR